MCVVYKKFLTDQRNELGRLRHVLSDEQHEDGVGKQDCDAKSDLLSSIGRQTEGQQAEKVQGDAWKDDVQQIVEDSTSDCDKNCDVRVDLGPNRILHLVTYDVVTHIRPLAVCYVVRHVDLLSTCYDIHLQVNKTGFCHTIPILNIDVHRIFI